MKKKKELGVVAKFMRPLKNRITGISLVVVAVLVLGFVGVSQSAPASAQVSEEKKISLFVELKRVTLDDIRALLGLSVPAPVEEFTLGAGSRFPNGISADTTSPLAGQVRGTTFLSTATTTIANSFDGFTVGGSVVVATGSPITLYTHSQGIALCSNHTAYAYWDNTGDFAPDLTFSVGTTTTAGTAVTNLIASSTVATSTTATGLDRIILADTLTDRFIIRAGELITMIIGDTTDSIVTDPTASSTNFSNWDVEFIVDCVNIGG